MEGQAWGQEQAGAFASFGERLLAVIIDSIIFAVPYIVLIIIKPLRFLAFIWLIAWVVYYFYLVATTGQSIGKKQMKIKIVRINGQPMDIGTALLRDLIGKWVSGLILYIGYLFPLWDPQKQALHDKIASTLVVKTG